MKTSEAVLRIKVQKKNPDGKVMVEYEGDELERNESFVKLEALFTRDDMPFMDARTMREVAEMTETNDIGLDRDGGM